MKTRKLFESARGGVLFIDEAYSLINGDSDSFGHEALNTLTHLITSQSDEEEEPGSVVVILAGYGTSMDSLFNDANPGLRRRFPWRFDLETPSAPTLCSILQVQLERHGWSLGGDALEYLQDVLQSHRSLLVDHAGSTDTLALSFKMSHARRNFPRQPSRVLHLEDIQEGWTSFAAHARRPRIPEEVCRMYL